MTRASSLARRRLIPALCYASLLPPPEAPMAYLLIWGETRELLPGDLAASLRAEEVRTLAALQAALDGKKAALVVPTRASSKPSRPRSRRGCARAARTRRDRGRRRPGRRRRSAAPVAIRRRPAPTSGHPGAAATPAGAGRRVPGPAQRDPADREGLQAQGRGAQPAQPDRGGALGRARHRPAPRADPPEEPRDHRRRRRQPLPRGAAPRNGGGDRLRFKLPQNDSVAVPFEECTIPLDETSIAGYVALTGKLVNVADAYNLPAGSPYTISRSFDEKSGYRTKSMLVVPMRDHQDKVIGVVQLINKKRDARGGPAAASLVEERSSPSRPWTRSW